MAITTDDCDIADVKFYMNAGHNGDYYLNLIEYNKEQKCVRKMDFRMAFSGSKIPLNVKTALVELFNQMELSGLNKHPKNDTNETKDFKRKD